MTWPPSCAGQPFSVPAKELLQWHVRMVALMGWSTGSKHGPGPCGACHLVWSEHPWASAESSQSERTRHPTAVGPGCGAGSCCRNLRHTVPQLRNPEPACCAHRNPLGRLRWQRSCERMEEGQTGMEVLTSSVSALPNPNQHQSRPIALTQVLYKPNASSLGSDPSWVPSHHGGLLFLRTID